MPEVTYSLGLRDYYDAGRYMLRRTPSASRGIAILLGITAFGWLAMAALVILWLTEGIGFLQQNPILFLLLFPISGGLVGGSIGGFVSMALVMLLCRWRRVSVTDDFLLIQFRLWRRKISWKDVRLVELDAGHVVLGIGKAEIFPIAYRAFGGAERATAFHDAAHSRWATANGLRAAGNAWPPAPTES